MSATVRDLEDYFSRTGAVRVLCELGPNGGRFNQLRKSIDISHPIIKDRLEDGEDLHIVKTTTIDTENGKSHKYLLTGEGTRLWFRMYEEGIVRAYYAYQKHKQDFEIACDTAREVLTKDTDFLRDPDVMLRYQKWESDNPEFDYLFNEHFG